MKRGKIGVILAGVAFIVTLVSCGTTPPATPEHGAVAVQKSTRADLSAVYAGLAATGGKSFSIEPKASTVRIYAFRGGTAAKLGHNHVLSAPKFVGFAHLPQSGVADARFDLEFQLDELEIDNAAYRAVLGAAFASVLTPAAIQGTREHMLGPDNMQADQYPFVRIHSLRITGEAPKVAAEVQVEMHGQSRTQWVPLTVEGLPDHLVVSGAFVLRQTDFGIKPYSVLGGVLSVKDEVVIEFRLAGA